MENKICPLLCACAADIPPECKGDRCAWYVPPVSFCHGGIVEGYCSIQMIGRSMPEVVRELRGIS